MSTFEQRVRRMTDDQLAYTLSDLKEVIAIQEEAQETMPGFGNLSRYYDERHAVTGEIALRKKNVTRGTLNDLAQRALDELLPPVNFRRLEKILETIKVRTEAL